MSCFSRHKQNAARLLLDQKQTISVAESSTGGLIAASLLSVPGASRYFMGGTVIYTIKSRRAFLELDRERIKHLEPLTEDMVMEFARATRKKLETTWGIAELGVAGPDSTPYSDETGVSVIVLSGPVDKAITVRTGHNDREKNMHELTDSAMQLIVSTLVELHESA